MRSETLSDALGVTGGVCAFVGAGGKTTAILRLASELAAAGRTALATTTTKVGPSMARELPLVPASPEPALDLVAAALAKHGAVLLVSAREPDGKYPGVDAEFVDRIAASGVADAILVEADGSRQRPLKAPADHEPVIPRSTDVVVPMVGLDVLGRFIDEASVHRPGLAAALARSDRATPDAVVRIVSAREGGLKDVPAGSAVRPILNKMTFASREAALEIALGILETTESMVDRVLLTDIRGGLFRFVPRSAR